MNTTDRERKRKQEKIRRKKQVQRQKILILIILIIIICAVFLSRLIYINSRKSSNAPADTESGAKTADADNYNTESADAAASSDSDGESTEGASSDASEENTDDIYTPPDYTASENRVTYQDGFYYEPVSDNEELMNRIRNLSYNESINTQVTFDDLSYIRIKYINFDNQEAEGEIICNTAIAQDLVEIFYDLYLAEYQIESVRLIDDFDADDQTSMEANNSSSFNYRTVSGTSTLSNHSYGLAIDINPLYNPYVYTSNGETVVEPASGAAYADRSLDFEHKIDENDLCYQLFIAHGFTWGGSWSSVKDYQHFEKSIE